jgi:AmiR/NasT family two-component response regulator
MVAAQRYAAPAAVVIRNAEVLADSRAEIEQLRNALLVRPVIDQAIGIIRSRTGKSEAEAFERLRVISNRVHVRVSEMAARIVDDAVRRAQQRRPGS